MAVIRCPPTGSVDVGQVAVALPALNVTVLALQPVMVLPSEKNVTFPEIVTTAVPLAGTTVAVNVTDVFSGTLRLLDPTVVVVLAWLTVCDPTVDTGLAM